MLRLSKFCLYFFYVGQYRATSDGNTTHHSSLTSMKLFTSESVDSFRRLKVSDGASLIHRMILDSGQCVQITRKRLYKLFCLRIHDKRKLSLMSSLYSVSLHVHDRTNTSNVRNQTMCLKFESGCPKQSHLSHL
jgi:hypothetical protein